MLECRSSLPEYVQLREYKHGPKLYRWLSERYPLMTQRHGVKPGADLSRDHLGRIPPDVLRYPNQIRYQHVGYLHSLIVYILI